MYNYFNKKINEKRLLDLQNQLQYCKNSSNYFKNIFENNNISIDKIDSLENNVLFLHGQYVVDGQYNNLSNIISETI